MEISEAINTKVKELTVLKAIMSVDLKSEDLLLQVRDKLRTEKIKLWLKPYYCEKNGPILCELEKLAREFNKTLTISYEQCYESLLKLQENALENLKQKTKFDESGLATLKIKILHERSPPKIITKEVSLKLKTCELKDMITKEISIHPNRLKLISFGKVLTDNETLESQNVKNGQMILTIILTDNPNAIEQEENEYKDLENAKTDSRLLALDDTYMNIEDQFGNAIKIPSAEKKTLIVAMTLQEKGKSALKRDDYSRALVFFSEADEEYKRCNSELLNLVDNYALLDLDIAWCYLCLQTVTNLPEAYERLARCENRFQKSYGTNLERLVAVKGSSGNEAALLMRLHLLQAIILYHQNKRDQALELLQRTEQELLRLKVDENCVLQLVEMGFSIAESRIGLRATQGDINLAANYINENRERRRESRKRAKAEEILQKERKKLGKCADGNQYVNPNFLQILVSMGYNKEIARIALQKTNNIISDSIQYIQENPTAGPSSSRSQEMTSLIEDLVPELMAAGFDGKMARLALQKHMGDIMKAAEELICNNGIIEGDVDFKDDNDESNESKENKEKKNEAFNRLTQDLTMEEDDYLDLTLIQEEQFLYQYLDLLKGISRS